MRIPISEKAVAVAVVVAAVLVSTTVPARAQERRTSPALAALVPRLEGWAPSEAPRGYFPESLFEYINGAAESYLSYDFRELLVADLQKKGTEATLTAEIYDMGDPLNAFGIYGAERYPENEPVGVGDLDYLEGESLNFLAGRYYVKLLAFGLGGETDKILREAGSKIAGAIGAKTGLPPLVRAFPAEGLVARSEKYIKRNFMGYEFLGNGYVAAYRSGREGDGGLLRRRGDRTAGRSRPGPVPRSRGRRRAGPGEGPGRRQGPEPLRPDRLHRPRGERPLRRHARPREPGGRGAEALRIPGRVPVGPRKREVSCA